MNKETSEPTGINVPRVPSGQRGDNKQQRCPYHVPTNLRFQKATGESVLCLVAPRVAGNLGLVGSR